MSKLYIGPQKITRFFLFCGMKNRREQIVSAVPPVLPRHLKEKRGLAALPAATDAQICRGIFAPFTTERKLCSEDQPHALQLPLVDGPALDGVEPGGADAGMAQDVRQP